MSARLLVIQHEDDCPPGWFGRWFAEAGIELEVLRAHRGTGLPDRLEAYDGLVVLGGEMSAYDDVRCPWLPPTRRLIARTVASDRPFLGVCLGHQLAAVALGGTVVSNPAGRACGITAVSRTPAGRRDALLGALDDTARAVQWNDDVIATLPEGAVALAHSPDGTVQAARFGPHAWGLQFHPEVTPDIFRSWTAGKSNASDGDSNGLDLDAVHRSIVAADADLQATWRPVADRFSDIVAAAHEGRAVPVTEPAMP